MRPYFGKKYVDSNDCLRVDDYLHLAAKNFSLSEKVPNKKGKIKGLSKLPRFFGFND